MEKKPKTKEDVCTVKEHAVGVVKDKVSQVGNIIVEVTISPKFFEFFSDYRIGRTDIGK